jgi:hypothetical protein
LLKRRGLRAAGVRGAGVGDERGEEVFVIGEVLRDAEEVI